MKSAFFLLVLFFISLTANAQAPGIQWQKSIGSSAADAGIDVQKTADGGYITLILGDANDGDFVGGHGAGDCWLVKLSAWGNIVWKKALGGSGDDVPRSIRQTADGGYIVSCSSNSTDGDITGNHGSFDYWIVKVDDTGKIQWQKSFGGTGQDFPLSVIQTADGGYIAAGWTNSIDGDVTGNHGNDDYWVIKLTSSGSLVWQHTYGGSDDDIATAVIQTTDGGYIVAGNTSSTDGDVLGNHGGDDFWIIKLSATGNITWQKCYGGTADEDVGDEQTSGSIEQTIDGGYILVGLSNSTDGDVTGYHGGFADYWTVKISATGSIEWQNCRGGSNDDDGYSIHQTADSGYIVAGASNSVDGDVVPTRPIYNYWVIKLSSTGALLWQNTYGGSKDDYAVCIQPTSDSEYIIIGYSQSNDSDVSGNHGDFDAWVTKLAYCSLPSVAGISGSSSVCDGSAITLNDVTPGGSWSTGNSNATVSGGVVTGLYPGTVPVFYTVTDACGTGGATQIVTVVPRPAPVIMRTGSMLSTTMPYTTYQWIKNGAPVAGATSATYTVTTTTTATYSVTVTSAYGCTATSDADTIHALAVGIINGKPDCTILPNPTSGMIYVKGTGNVRIRLYNAVGQLVQEAVNTDHITITEFPAGMYLIRLFDEVGALMLQEKIMKE